MRTKDEAVVELSECKLTGPADKSNEPVEGGDDHNKMNRSWWLPSNASRMRQRFDVQRRRSIGVGEGGVGRWGERVQRVRGANAPFWGGDGHALVEFRSGVRTRSILKTDRPEVCPSHPIRKRDCGRTKNVQKRVNRMKDVGSR